LHFRPVHRAAHERFGVLRLVALYIFAAGLAVFGQVCVAGVVLRGCGYRRSGSFGSFLQRRRNTFLS
jgi:hypothetical protein